MLTAPQGILFTTALRADALMWEIFWKSIMKTHMMSRQTVPCDSVQAPEIEKVVTDFDTAESAAEELIGKFEDTVECEPEKAENGAEKSRLVLFVCTPATLAAVPWRRLFLTVNMQGTVDMQSPADFMQRARLFLQMPKKPWRSTE